MIDNSSTYVIVYALCVVPALFHFSQN